VFPHFQFSEQIQAAGFTEPAFWNVTKSDEMSAMLAFLDEVTWGRLSVADFFAKYPPVNAYDNYEKIVDPEGFVIYDLLRELSYGKIKSVLYYVAHKFREENVKMLLDLITANPNCSFPLAVLIRDTIAPMDTILQEVKGKLIDVVEELHTALPPRILAAYNKSKKVQIFLSDTAAKAAFLERAFPIFAEAFPKLMEAIPNLLEKESATPDAAVKDKKFSKVKKPMKTDLENSIVVFASNGGCAPAELDFENKHLLQWRSEFVALLVK